MTATEFYGTVLLREWTNVPWAGGQFKGFTGKCQVVSAAEVLGHQVNDRDSNWAIIVAGNSLDVVALGCQVSMVVRRRNDTISLTAVTDIIEVP